MALIATYVALALQVKGWFYQRQAAILHQARLFLWAEALGEAARP